MMKRSSYIVVFGTFAIGATLAASSTFAQSVDTARIEAAGQNDWLTYHGSYKSYHYSSLAQINNNNVGNLAVAWMHIPGRSTRGLQSTPLVADGVLYIGSEDNHVYALNATTGLPLWSFTAGFVVDSPPAVVNGVLYIGSHDGNVYVFH